MILLSIPLLKIILKNLIELEKDIYFGTNGVYYLLFKYRSVNAKI